MTWHTDLLNNVAIKLITICCLMMASPFEVLLTLTESADEDGDVFDCCRRAIREFFRGLVHKTRTLDIVNVNPSPLRAHPHMQRPKSPRTYARAR